MNGRWFRFYDGVVDDPKVQRLAATLFRFWVNVLCLASRNGGDVPALADMAFCLRLPEKTVLANLALLIEAGLVDELNGVSTPHNWNARQFKSDVSNERVKRHRERHKPVTGNDDVTLHVTPPETEQRQSRTEQKELFAAKPARSKPPTGDFDQFWNACPKKVGKGKAQAIFAKVTAKDVQPETLIAAMRRYADTQDGKDPTYTAHPATWLNAQRWLDEDGTGPPTLRVVVSDEVAAQEKENLKRMGLV